MQISEMYQWQVETAEGEIRTQYNADGTENPFKDIECDRIVRVSILPTVLGKFLNEDFPRHDVFIDITKGEKFVKRFGRGFLKNKGEGFELSEYVHCVETGNYRLWVFSTSGQVMITRPDFELYI